MRGIKTAFCGLLLVAVMVFAGCQVQTPVQPTQPLKLPTEEAPKKTVSCPSTGKTDGKVKYEDTLASTTTFDASPTVYFTSADTADVTAGTLSASDYSAAVDLECGKTYKPIAVSTNDDMASAVGTEFIASGSAATQTLAGHKVSILQLKIKDLVNDVYFNLSGTGQTETSTSYVHLSGTTVTGMNVTDQSSSYTSMTINADGYIDARIDVKTNVTKAKFGEAGLRTFLCVNANSDKWSEPSVSIGDAGESLTDAFDSLNREDQKAMNGYEYCYQIPQIGETTTSIYYYQSTAGGVNPGSTDTPIIRFISEGRYQSSKEVDAQGDKKVLVGCFQDNAANTEVGSALAQGFTFVTT